MNGVNEVYFVESSSPTTTNTGDIAENSLGKNAFLTLLVTQLKHQDPMNPVENHEFVAQMAQFTTLEQMQNLNEKFQSMMLLDLAAQSASLLGKKIETVDPATGEPIIGTVSSIKLVDGEAMLVIGDDEVPLTDITQISEDGFATAQSGAEGQNIFS